MTKLKRYLNSIERKYETTKMQTYDDAITTNESLVVAKSMKTKSGAIILYF